MTAGGSAAILAHLGKNRICRTTQALVCARTKSKRHDCISIALWYYSNYSN